MRSAPDDVILAWAANANRIVVTYDIKTMPGFAYARLAAGQAMFGVLGVPDELSFGEVIDDLLTVAGASWPEEWEGRVEYLPL